jgi:hypothetical protein
MNSSRISRNAPQAQQNVQTLNSNISGNNRKPDGQANAQTSRPTNIINHNYFILAKGSEANNQSQPGPSNQSRIISKQPIYVNREQKTNNTQSSNNSSRSNFEQSPATFTLKDKDIPQTGGMIVRLQPSVQKVINVRAPQQRTNISNNVMHAGNNSSEILTGRQSSAFRPAPTNTSVTANNAATQEDNMVPKIMNVFSLANFMRPN